MELDLLTGLMPRQQVLLKRPDLAKVLTLTVDPKSYWIYTNTPIDNERVAAIVSRVRLRGGPRPPRRVGLSEEVSHVASMRRSHRRRWRVAARRCGAVAGVARRRPAFAR